MFWGWRDDGWRGRHTDQHLKRLTLPLHKSISECDNKKSVENHIARFTSHESEYTFFRRVYNLFGIADPKDVVSGSFYIKTTRCPQKTKSVTS